MPYQCSVKLGNLLDEPNATFMVNASNTTLQLGSGVSSAFKLACGIALQQEMTHKLHTLGHLLHKGDVVATSSADATSFKYALHTCVMDYNQGIRGEDRYPNIRDIQAILENIECYLQWYAEHDPLKRIKLVLPLLGCGVGGLDAKDVLELYKSYFKKNIQFVCDVVIYAYSPEDYTLAQKICARQE